MHGILLYLLPVSIDVLDKGVGNPVPGELLTSGSSKQRMVAKMGGCVDHLLFVCLIFCYVGRLLFVWLIFLGRLLFVWLTICLFCLSLFWITGIVVLYPSMSFPSQNVSTMCSLMSGKALSVLRTRAVRFSMPLMYSPMNVMLSQSSTMYLCR